MTGRSILDPDFKYTPAAATDVGRHARHKRKLALLTAIRAQDVPAANPKTRELLALLKDAVEFLLEREG